MEPRNFRFNTHNVIHKYLISPREGAHLSNGNEKLTFLDIRRAFVVSC